MKIATNEIADTLFWSEESLHFLRNAHKLSISLSQYWLRSNDKYRILSTLNDLEKEFYNA